MFLLTLGALAWCVAPASAAGVNLGWGDCGAAPSTLNATFACNTNTGNSVMIGSYVSPAGIDSANGIEAVIDLQTSGASLPQWWQVKGTGTCRNNALVVSFNFGTGPFTCLDYWDTRGGLGAFGSYGYTPGFGGANRARAIAVASITNGSSGGIAPGVEVYAFRFTLTNAKTVGGAACGGCTDGACIVLNSIRVTQNAHSAFGPKFLGNPAVRNYITWQAGVANCGANVTPARNTTWGAIKSIYR